MLASDPYSQTFAEEWKRNRCNQLLAIYLFHLLPWDAFTYCTCRTSLCPCGFPMVNRNPGNPEDLAVAAATQPEEAAKHDRGGSARMIADAMRVGDLRRCRGFQ